MSFFPFFFLLHQRLNAHRGSASHPSQFMHPGTAYGRHPRRGLSLLQSGPSRSGRSGWAVGRSVGRLVFPSQPSFFMQARCLSRSVENVQCSEYMHCFPQNEDSKSLQVSLGCEGWPGPITSHRTVSQSPGSPVTRYPIPGTCCMYCILYTVYTVQHHDIHPGHPDPKCAFRGAHVAAPASCCCPTLPNRAHTVGSNIYYSTSMLHERLTYVLNFLKLCFWQCTDREGRVGGKMNMYMFRRRTSCGSPGLRCARLCVVNSNDDGTGGKGRGGPGS